MGLTTHTASRSVLPALEMSSRKTRRRLGERGFSFHLGQNDEADQEVTPRFFHSIF
jgi:hypothetical protein